ncbi:MAG: hypothetical protein JRI44_14055 [Deltaproteobacteria bacterium]|nr:hypothetical protein [Deltaproteobacteria bacterium]
MQKDKIIKKPVKGTQIGIRISKRLNKWMRDNNYSPTRIFMEAVKELGYKKNGDD